MRILVMGGTGFIGRRVAARLARAGHRVRVPTRRLAHGRELLVLPTVTVLERDVHDDAVLDALLRDCEAVVNLVGILHGGRGRPYGGGFARAHVELPRRLAQACLRQGVRRLVHVSALGADSNGPSMYARSKGDGEAAIREAYAQAAHPGWTILRPSVVFGPEDNFTNLFARLARWLPVLMVPGARSRVQPVYVGDVAQVISTVLRDPEAAGACHELAGPEIYTLAELAGRCALWSGHPRPVMGLPGALARLQAAVLECLPGEPLISRDNLDSLSRDNIASGPLDPALRLVPTALEAVAPAYLARQ
ncbi:complex I NDUFA9 subunit family protein [Bordetella hinzii]|uniref:NAD(P)H-binding protein, PF13460 family n=1 Tax=Bordetella hinzii OH87 BAL007II TaxID=1331262 RepID=A0ABR4R6G7_9BORD|nr:complex I NDUFA9 subunit family protein [Bordetella hinzii]KCB25941.1 NAD(P)H-binding protein, PF13460 family [Bordetella hinzii OH87 BAL007II]KCB41481.1 NAD(P)H-binding protein, PF13460 family [Bordetella hinzii 5132]QDJ40490.1 complex I NDUFA9 subunit family protein [Bordetella hinzii]QDJ45051.1 complex I NDUFA9 subunit family protein [Bordetella hinzii]QDJ53962.1 complex I NDUFA9 subunit family protein [Bordetella hinzii]